MIIRSLLKLVLLYATDHLREWEFGLIRYYKTIHDGFDVDWGDSTKPDQFGRLFQVYDDVCGELMPTDMVHESYACAMGSEIRVISVDTMAFEVLVEVFFQYWRSDAAPFVSCSV